MAFLVAVSHQEQSIVMSSKWSLQKKQTMKTQHFNS